MCVCIHLHLGMDLAGQTRFPELFLALISYLPPFHLCQSPASPTYTFQGALGHCHTCWCCWKGIGPLASCCPWLDSLCSRLSSPSGPTPPPSVSRSSAEGICHSRGFSLGLAGLWRGEMPAEKSCWSVGCGAGHGGFGGHSSDWNSCGHAALCLQEPLPHSSPLCPCPSRASLLLSAPKVPVKQPLITSPTQFLSP